MKDEKEDSRPRIPHRGKLEFSHFEMRPARKASHDSAPSVIHQAHFKRHRGGSGGGPAWDPEVDEGEHKTRAQAKKHFNKMLDHVFGPAENEEEENEPKMAKGGKPAPEPDEDDAASEQQAA